ncbi:cytochrome c3 family protein [Frigoriglobus tundricola]|uniref:cytochrome c3 family protein n=1 Tax=Frigoriglobus tundricola TaxID=2774151 RepID=UPI00148ECA4F|nr:cytochrome c3 family protein [Frigoriglobus tundricola]
MVAAPAAADTFRIEPVPDRTVWFTHAKFNHSAHRGTTCATCHPGTGAATIAPADANKPEPTQILGVESCRACHSPAGTKVTLPDGSKVAGGGVRAACTDCHRYHHNDTPLQGRGSPARFPKDPRGLADWLKGK